MATFWEAFGQGAQRQIEQGQDRAFRQQQLEDELRNRTNLMRLASGLRIEEGKKDLDRQLRLLKEKIKNNPGLTNQIKNYQFLIGQGVEEPEAMKQAFPQGFNLGNFFNDLNNQNPVAGSQKKRKELE